MKKINKIISALASLTVAVAALTGCPSVNADLETVAIPTHIVGGFKQADVDAATWKAEDNGGEDFFPLTFKEVDGEKIAEFQWKQDSNKWGAGYPTDTQDFQLTLGLSWDSVWKKGEKIALNSEYAKVAYGIEAPDSNIKLTGLKQGESYTMKIWMDGSDVKVKVEGKAETFTELKIIANGVATTMNRLNGTYTGKVPSTGTALAYSIYDGSKTWALSSTDAASFELGKEYTYVEAEKASSIAVEEGFDYEFTATLADNGAPKVKIEKGRVKVYIAGDSPLNWDIGTDSALQMTQIGETTTYFYSFKAETPNLMFKVATKNSWDYAYSNCENTNGETETTVGGEYVDYSQANKKNAKITGLTTGDTYTVVTDISGDNPKVRVYYGDPIFIIGAGKDFGSWNWNSEKQLLASTTKNTWTYTFTASGATDGFKFTKGTSWDNGLNLGSAAALTVGGDATALSNGSDSGNIKASLTANTGYVITLSLEGDTYKAKIATANN